MVTLLSNAGIRLTMDQAISNSTPPSSISLYPPYSSQHRLPYTFSSHLPHHNPQLHSSYQECQPDTTEQQPKKPKPSKKKPEKVPREDPALRDCTKESLATWLKSLSLEEKFEIFSIKSYWLVITFVKMYEKWAEVHGYVFNLLADENKEISLDETLFYCRKNNTERGVHMDKAEEELIESIRIYDDNTQLYEMIGFKEELLQDTEKMLKLFDIISGEKVFTSKPTNAGSEQGNNNKDSGSKTPVVDKPHWFKKNSFQSLAEWIVASFEKAIWTKYLQNKKNTSKYPSIWERLDTRITLSYKKNLGEFWRGLEQDKRLKIAAAANEIFDWLNTPDSEKKASDNSKEINQKLKKMYESATFEKARAGTTNETISSYFTHLVEEKNEATVIETILMTSLGQFGTIQNLICRKLAHKIRNMFSEKVASDLILNEEKEKKPASGAGNNNKKKAKKKKAKKAAAQQEQANINEDEEIEIVGARKQTEEGIGNSDGNQKEEKQGKGEQQESLGDSYDNKSKEKGDKCEKEEEDKEVEMVAPVKGRSKNKKKDSESQKTMEERKVSSCEEDEGKKETGKETGESAQNNEKDTWALIEEDEKRMTKSQKRKQKKKMKKAEQEAENEKEEEDKITIDKQESSSSTLKNNSTTAAIVENDVVVVNKKDKQKEEKKRKEETKKEQEASCPVVQQNQKPQNKAAGGHKEEIRRESRLNETKRGPNSSNRKNGEPVSAGSGKVESQAKASHQNTQEKCVKGGPVKEDKSSKEAVAMTVAPVEDETGFIEVKPKKKLEKEGQPKDKRDSKGFGRRKNPKEEGENRKGAKGGRRTKSPVNQSVATGKKGPGEAHQTKPAGSGNEKSNGTVVEKNGGKEGGMHRNNVGIPKIIPGPAVMSKSQNHKPSRKNTTDIHLEGSSNSSEGEGTPCNTRNTSHTSRSSYNPNRSPQETITDSASDHKFNNGGSHSHSNHNHRGHPLSLSSPSLDAETIKIAQAKSLAHKMFNKKFESEISNHVLELTDEANKMTDYRIIAYQRLDYCISSLFPSFNVQTKIFGSCATGLALPTSDVDILVSGLGAYDRFSLREYLLLISSTLGNFKWITSNEPILTATVPILKLEIDLKVKFNELKESMPDGKIWGISTDKKEKLNIQNIEGKDDDIKIRVDLSLESVGMGNLHLGYKTTAFVQRMLHKYKSLYTVTMFLKEFLNNRKLLNIYKGGVSSYCLVIMIVALFNKFKDEGYMASLWRFFNFYGEVFKPEATGISLIEKEPFFPLTQSSETAPLWIIADTNMFNRKNIGIGVYSIKNILNEFAKASQIIEHYRKSFEQIAVRYSEAITSVDDFSKIENDPDLKILMSTNIAKLIIRDT